jgi:hypothetical protein
VTAAALDLTPGGATLTRPDAQPVADWPTPPPDPAAELAASIAGWVAGGGGQPRSSARTAAAWPSAFTLPQARSTRPCSSTRKVERSTPTEVRP